MKIKIKLHPSSAREEIKRVDDGSYEIWMKEKPVDGKANLELVKVLKKYFSVRDVKIKSGFTSRNKIVEVLE